MSDELPSGCDVVLVSGTPAGPLPAWPVPWALVNNITPNEASQQPGGRPPTFQLPAVVSQRSLRRQLESLWAPLPPPPPASNPNAVQWDLKEVEGLKVLVVDDSKVNQVVLQGFLKRLRCPTDVGLNGAEAVAAIAAKDYDVAILDLQMPVLDGLDAAHLAKALPRVPYLVAASSTPGELVHGQCLEAGFDAFIQKPIRFPELCRLLLDAKRAQCPTLSRCSGAESMVSIEDRLPVHTPMPSPPCHPNQPFCTFNRCFSEIDIAALHTAETFTPTPTPTPRRSSSHLKVLSSLRATVGLAPKAPPQVSTRATLVVQKSPVPPNSPSYKRPSRLFGIVCPPPAMPP
eukprot:GGOE01011656.1.p1 GENE.GGOE01011656.1~~GGOE01011656.1.p1  ORF type:complete len:367 (-),score=91.86 GGOE01011656.1:1971-3005(-)